FFMRVLGLPLDWFEIERVRMPAIGSGSSLRPVYAYTGANLGALVYAQPALTLETACRVYGRARCDAALARYRARNRFQHVGIAQLGAAFDAIYGAGFSTRELQPALEGKRAGLGAEPATPDRERKRVLAPPAPAPRAGDDSLVRPESLAARLVFIVQALLGGLGP